ncbi:MAG: TIGR02921 family PEP-CTERM protein [Cyanobacteria bacterium P01_E01_bin.35]
MDAHGDWANVEIHEVYENQTNDVEEILYYFSLPESAAITGLWLGETEDLNQRFAYQVAPRGAAQEVYNSQVRRTRPVDPALLEQVGSGQYRLRAFPVPPKRTINRNGNRAATAATPKMHLWLTYQVMRQDRGWALPKLAEKRNIFWTGFTKRIRNGQTKWFFADAWMEDFAEAPNNIEGQTYQLNLEDGYIVTAQPLNRQDYSLPSNKKYALILDTSYSMDKQIPEIRATFDWVQNKLTNNQIDIFLTDALASQAKRFTDLKGLNPEQLTFYGSLQTEQMLQQFEGLRKNKEYDAVLLLTDQGSYELSEDKAEIPPIKAPLWMIHLGGKLPRAYNDGTLNAIQNSSGGVATDVATVMKRLATETVSVGSVVDGYSWAVTKSDSKASFSTSVKGLEPIAARQLVFALARTSKNQPSLAELDAIHQVAKNNDVVTSYSSMIVLVNDRQREQLKAAEQKADRFNREVETGVEQLETPFDPFESAEVSGVPEPSLWILWGVLTLALFLVYQKQKARIENLS